MSKEPRTRKEAELFRYGKSGIRPSGSPYDPARCAAVVPEGGRSVLFRQCGRKPGFGPDGIFCKQHADKIKD